MHPVNSVNYGKVNIVHDSPYLPPHLQPLAQMVDTLRRNIGVTQGIQLTITDKTEDLARVKNGHIVVHTSLLNRPVWEQEYTLAHEIAHIKIGHKIVVPYSIAHIDMLCALTILFLSAIIVPHVVFIISVVIAASLGALESFGFSVLVVPYLMRKEEIAADRLGFLACSPQTQAVLARQRRNNTFLSGGGGLLSEHPSGQERRRNFYIWYHQLPNRT